jgi:hypothetical protein
VNYDELRKVVVGEVGARREDERNVRNGFAWVGCSHDMLFRTVGFGTCPVERVFPCGAVKAAADRVAAATEDQCTHDCVALMRGELSIVIPEQAWESCGW